jgi:hypothetical protein
MHHLIINTGTTTDDAYNQEQGETVVEGEKEVGEEGIEEEEDDEPIVATTPVATARGRKKAAPKKGGGS